jgi:hypothetical protein
MFVNPTYLLGRMTRWLWSRILALTRRETSMPKILLLICFQARLNTVVGPLKRYDGAKQTDM